MVTTDLQVHAPDKTLLLIRGVPGSGKTTLANLINNLSVFSVQVSNDGCWDPPYGPNNPWNFEDHKVAIAECYRRTEEYMANEVPLIIVHNTFVKEFEIEKYTSLAADHYYRVISVVVENRHGGKTVNHVPEETIQRMKDNFSWKL